MKNKAYLIIMIAVLSSCGIYSFTGASIPEEAQTVSVNYFYNKASTVQPTLSQVFTEKLKDLFTEQTDLTLTNDEGDLVFSGYISKYKVKPIAIKANETTSQNRLTISVSVNYKNKFNTSNSFKETFSRYRDYESSQNITEIEESLIEEITNDLAEDVFNKAFVNW